tara:strand:+ start:313 stop:957 length:645 start_codon:yes stop_codon:yes gene_type:complete
VEFVPKPWGREYLCWKGNATSIWALELNHNKSTSFHCHCNKNTGLIVLDGEVSVELLNGKFNLSQLQKINIFQRRFHKSTAVSENGAIILEIESPVNKEDLVRWTDMHGRTSSAYESERKQFENSETFIDLQKCLKKPQKHFGLEFLITNSSNFDFVDDKENNLIVPLEGGLIHEDEESMVVGPGDVLTLKIYKMLAEKFSPSKDFISLYIRKA